MATNCRWEDKYVKCPFYRKSNPGRIVCEGFQEGSAINVTFDDRGEKMRYMKKRCVRALSFTQFELKENELVGKAYVVHEKKM